MNRFLKGRDGVWIAWIRLPRELAARLASTRALTCFRQGAAELEGDSCRIKEN